MTKKVPREETQEALKKITQHYYKSYWRVCKE